MFGNQLSVLFDRTRAEKFGSRRTLQRTPRRQTLPRQATPSTKSSSEGDTESQESNDTEPEVVVITDSEDETHRETIGLGNRRNRSPISTGKDQTATECMNFDPKSTGKLNGATSTVNAREQTVSGPRAIKEKPRPLQWPQNANTTRSNGAAAGQLDSAKELDDIASTAWLQEQLARADAGKKRTVFLPGPPLPVPREKRQKPCVPFRGVGGGSFHVPIRVSKEAKQNDLDVNRATEAGEALSRYLEKDPESERTLQEYEEYTTCKEKLDRGETLVAVERERMRSIKRNVERREYSLQRKRPPQKTPTASRAKKQKVESQTAKTSMTNSKKADTSEVEEDHGIGELERAPRAFYKPSESSTKTSSSQALDCSPTSKNSIGPGTEPYGKEEWDDSPQSDEYLTARNRVIQEPRKTVAGKGVIKEILEQNQHEEPPESMVSDESSSEEEDGEIEEEEPFWQYDVYRREIKDPGSDCDPIFIGTYLNRRRAEEVVKSEIFNIQSRLRETSLQELCEFEFSCKVEQDGIQEQTLTFPSGRSAGVFIEKGVVPEGPGNCTRPKKARLPTKHYLVMEETMETEPADETSKTERAVETRRTVNKESYVFWQDANKQANKLFINHQTAQFEADEKFDIGITGKIDTDGRRYLHELEAGERLFDKTTDIMPLGKDGKRFKAHIWVQGLLLRGPRN